LALTLSIDKRSVNKGEVIWHDLAHAMIKEKRPAKKSTLDQAF
jgi:hypothetical protein